MFRAVWNTSGTLLAGAEWYNETMDVLSYLMDLTGHLLQMLPPMVLYFLCVPDDLFRYSKRKTFISFGIISVAILLCGTAAEHFVLKQILSLPPVFITSNALLIEFLALSVLARVYVLAPVWPNHIVFLLVFFWGTMQYNISNFILSISGRYGVYDLAMLDELNALAEQYGLRLHTHQVTPYTLEDFYRAAGTGAFLADGAGSFRAFRQNGGASKSGRFRLFHRRFACRRNTPSASAPFII